ncbi:MAG: hypothetical protein WDN45_12085 [Caulobacteraceae bacterium]
MSQVLTLFSTPVVYYYLDRIGERFSRKGPQTGHAHKDRPTAPAAAHEVTLGEGPR